MLGHALCHALSFHSQTITHSVTNNQSYYQNNQSYWKTINPTTDLLLWGSIYAPNTTVVHPPIFFNGSEVAIKLEHKHLGMILDSKLNFHSHIREAIIKARRGVRIIRFLSKYVSRDVLDQIYKLYVRPHLDYGDIITSMTQNLNLTSPIPDRCNFDICENFLYFL